MIPTDRLQPGHAACCLGCSNQTDDLSHPSPCRLVRWEAQRHVGPALVAEGDGVACSDHKPTEPSPSDAPQENLPPPPRPRVLSCVPEVDGMGLGQASDTVRPSVSDS
jgi:hypothetical protein